jgi:predicted DNA binding CopG/RHH family protein
MRNVVKSEKGYEKITFETRKIKAAYKKMKAAKKQPTSINLAEETINDLKKVASSRGIPYQTLMRMLVIEGLDRIKKSA